MKSRLLALSVGTVAVLLFASSTFAHHTWAVDSSHAITVTGTVTGVDWSNPHVQIFVEGTDGNGKVEKWIVGILEDFRAAKPLDQKVHQRCLADTDGAFDGDVAVGKRTAQTVEG